MAERGRRAFVFVEEVELGGGDGLFLEEPSLPACLPAESLTFLAGIQ